MTTSLPRVRSEFAIPLRPEHHGIVRQLADSYQVDEADILIDIGFSYLSGGRINALIPGRDLFLRLSPAAERREAKIRYRARWAILKRLGPPHAAVAMREIGDHIAVEYAFLPGVRAPEVTPALIEANLRHLARLMTIGQVLGLERDGRRLVHDDLGPANTLVNGSGFHVIDYDAIIVHDVDWVLGRLMLNAMLNPIATSTAEQQARAWSMSAGPILAFACRHARMRDERDLLRQALACVAALRRWLPRFEPYGRDLARAVAITERLLGEAGASAPRGVAVVQA